MRFVLLALEYTIIALFFGAFIVVLLWLYAHPSALN